MKLTANENYMNDILQAFR